MSKPVNGSLFRRGTTVDKKIVIAIDFGTSRTGYAFALKENKKVADVGVNVQLTWPDMYEKYCKTVTQLLYDPSDKCIAWGYSAIKRMTELTDELEERSLGYVVVKYFKMALRDPNGVFRDPTTGRQFKVVDMITEYLSRLYAQIMSDVTEVTKKTFKREEISWCLTVPAIWEDAQKEAMKVAAFRAKMIESVDVSDDDFLLVLEPEAAGVWCKVLQEANNDGFADGETFLVIDAGGGTIDLTAHEVAKGGLLREITRGSGNDLGSSKLDVKFWELLESSFGGKQNIESFKREYPFAVRELVGEWEKCKCNIDALSKTIYMRLPLDMVDWFQELEGTNINKRIVDVKSGRLKLDASELSKIYSEIVSSITTIVENQFAEYKKSSRKSFDYLCLVGGFGGSKVLQTALKSTFEDTKRVKKLIVPHSPGSAIVSGAVLLGYDHNLIKTRRMRTTYGIQTMVPYDTGKHKVSKKKVVQGKEYCDGYFKKFVVSGQEVEVGMKATEVLKAASPTQTSMLVGVYCHPFEPTTTSPLDYIDDRGVKKIGEIIVDLTRTVGVPNRQVQISMVFGKSEVLLEVTALNTSDRYEAKIKFEGNKLAEYTGPKYTPPPEVLYHHIFVNDVSGSMSSQDVVPSDSYLKTACNNRVGALLQANQMFLTKRQGSNDIVSCINYDSSATIVLREQRVVSPEQTVRSMVSGAGGGTNYVAALNAVNVLLKSLSSTGYVVAVYFMTDGENTDDHAPTLAGSLASQYSSLGFKLHTIGIGNSVNESLLRNIASQGKGSFFRGELNLKDMERVYEQLAGLLDK